MSIIKAEDLTKIFKRPVRNEGFKGMIKDLLHRKHEEKVAVSGLSFEIERGELVGFLGPNGAGKSTSIKMLVGILVPTKGSAIVNGLEPYHNRTENAKRIGVVFGQRSQLWWDIPVSETLNLMKYMYRIPDDIFKHNMEMFMDLLGIGEFMNVAVRQLSLGQRMRADLCASLLHNPEVVFLDEPTIGLDVVVKKRIREFLLELNRTKKTTILLTTHDITDIEKLCQRVIIINHGTKIYDGDLQRLRNEYSTGEVMKLRVEGVFNLEKELLALGVQDVEAGEEHITIHYDRRHVTSATILSHVLNKVKIIDFDVLPCETEEIIRGIYAEKKEKAG